MDDTTMQFFVSLCLAVALAATAGLRAFYPLLALSIAAHLGWVTLSPSFAWLGHETALAALVVAAGLELLADKAPGLDHALHAFGMIVAPIAGTLVAASTLKGVDPAAAAALGLIAGGVPAATIHAARATLRPVSTFTTAGLGNPVVSLGEDGLAIGGIVLAFLVPMVAAAGAIAMVVGAVLLIRKILQARRSRSAGREDPGTPPRAPVVAR